MKVGTSTVAALGLTAGAIAGIGSYNLSKPKIDGLKEDWVVGSVALATAVPAIIGGSSLMSPMTSASPVGMGKAAGLLGASAVVGALFGVGIAAASRYDGFKD